MKIVDLHCDTLSALRMAARKGETKALGSNDLHIDLDKLEKGGSLLQCFAAFVFLGEEGDPLLSALEQIDLFYQAMERHSERIRQVKTWADLERNRAGGKLSAMLTLEDGGMCRGDLSVLRTLYRLGARIMSLTWNFENEIAFPNRFDMATGAAAPENERGLKERGYEFIAEMERLGMIVDVSHLGDDGFWDVVKYCDGPFVASHSNARAVCGHTRNLTDGMIRALADKGGVMGLNFCGDFLERGSQGTLEEMIRHLRHVRNVGGIGVIGLGTDFDGIDNVPEVEHAGQMPRLAEAMDQAGFSASEIDAVFSGNVLRVYRACMK